jgi:hypothetical protein
MYRVRKINKDMGQFGFHIVLTKLLHWIKSFQGEWVHRNTYSKLFTKKKRAKMSPDVELN